MTTSPRTLRFTVPQAFAKLGGADAALALFVVTVVGLMVIPLPTWLLSALTANQSAKAMSVSVM